MRVWVFLAAFLYSTAPVGDYTNELKKFPKRTDSAVKRFLEPSQALQDAFHNAGKLGMEYIQNNMLPK